MGIFKKEKIKNILKENNQGFTYKGNTYFHHTSLPHHESAFFRLSRTQKIIILLVIIVILASLIINWKITMIIGISVLTIIYFTDLLFNLFLILKSFNNPPEIKINSNDLKQLDDDSLPKYTILCPLYKEWEVLSQFTKAISRLDYPKDRLQVMLLFEEDDFETIQKVKNIDLPDYFKVVIVPDSLPKTKPKALNYGLNMASGDLVVVYDAEDIPDPLQLKKVILAFRKSKSDVRCIQAKLNFYNPHQNVLTRVFTAEYSLWFDLILTGLQSIQAPIPLGGTSNHFRKKDLINLKKWDAFNVTEDCDLGIRLAKNGYKTSIVNSVTLEEGNSKFINWFRQRSRWIKGYMQTYLVHMRNPLAFPNSIKNPHAITFQLVVGGKIASFFINPLMWLITVFYFIFRPWLGESIESFFPAPIFYMALFSFLVGNFLYIYYYIIGAVKTKQWKIVEYAFLVPIYWLMMSIAAWMALYQLIFEPHYWEKTVHGLSEEFDMDTNLILSKA